MSDFKRAGRKIDRYKREMFGALGSGLRVAGEEIMTDVRASRPGVGVPRKTGALAASGRVEGPDKDIAVTLSFGGAAAPYALVQHENMEYVHPVGEARYLVRGVERYKLDGSAALTALRDNAEYAARKVAAS